MIAPPVQDLSRPPRRRSAQEFGGVETSRSQVGPIAGGPPSDPVDLGPPLIGWPFDLPAGGRICPLPLSPPRAPLQIWKAGGPLGRLLCLPTLGL